MTPNTLGIITARGGSKGIPRKNVKPLLGKPLIRYTIDSAKAAQSLSRVIVSTDDDEIASLSQEAGVEVVMRPAEYATDTARTEQALIHVVETLTGRGEAAPEAVVTLEPTSPLRTATLIDRCIECLMSTEGIDAVVSIVDTSSLVGRLVDGRFRYLIEGQPRRRQEREPLYKESSTVYATDTRALLATGSVLGTNLGAVVADEEEAIDINTPTDFVIVEAVMAQRARARKESGDFDG